MKRPEEEYWVCVIGPANINGIDDALDLPMGAAVRKTFRKITGHDAAVTSSGWGVTKEGRELILKAWSAQPDWVNKLNPRRYEGDEEDE